MALNDLATNASRTATPARKEKSTAAIKDAASVFLSHKRVAVTGVSRTPGNHGSNVVYKRLRERGYDVFVYKRLRERGYDVFAVNPNADEVEGPAGPRFAGLGALTQRVRRLSRATARARRGRGRGRGRAAEIRRNHGSSTRTSPDDARAAIVQTFRNRPKEQSQPGGKGW
jgi:hypothetical protein